MKRNTNKIFLLTAITIFLPVLANAQDISGEIHSLQSVLDELYDDMLPLCNQLIGVGRGIAGFAALWYIGSRVWRSIAAAEPIDFYPLLRPFALGLAILMFPTVIAVMNGILKPTVTGTAAMMNHSNDAIAYLLKKKEESLKSTTPGYLYGDEGTQGRWTKYMYPDQVEEQEEGLNLFSNAAKFLMAKAEYQFKAQVKKWLAEILQIVYEAAALCINTLRTFYLIVLAILGPLVFGIAVFDGLQNTLTVWIARYINVFLWLPVANIFGSIIAKVQVNMLLNDIQQIGTDGATSFSSTDSGYIIFLIIAIIGYFTVPSVANYIVHAGGENHLMARASNFFVGGAMASTTMVATGARAAAGFLSSTDSKPQGSQGSNQNSNSNTGSNDNYMRDKLSGNKS